ncbi:FG-GAP repeat domain-containing protein [Streptomyces sp. NPDC127066]|uniref:FG-GAP repeat domain-containing protein n=1 Tax=Streptomyces sp. NPDC127066 TaxID=3347125 RepID=UPI0036618F75
MSMTIAARKLAAATAVAAATVSLVAVTAGTSHAASSQGGTITRAEVLSRAENWLARDVPYSQDASASDVDGDHSYRTDCSGFVSMTWHLTTSLTTATLATSSLTDHISTSDLQPGDALDTLDGHVVLFEKWIDKADGQFSYIAESSPTNDMVRGSDYLDGGSDGEIAGHPASGYFGLRYVNIAGGSKTGHDFTGDGIDDLAGVDADGLLHVYRNNGSGGLSGSDVGPGWTAMDKVASADFNGDGNADIVATNGSTGDLYLYLGNGSGGFKSSAKIGSGWGGVSQMAAGDFTGDGKADIIAVNQSDGTLNLYGGTGNDVTFTRQIGNGWSNMSRLSVGDFTGDGKADIVAANNTTGDLNLYTSSGTAVSGTTKIGSNWGAITKITLSDVDNDGKADVIAVNGTSGALLQYTSTGTGLKSGVEIGHGWSTMRNLI